MDRKILSLSMSVLPALLLIGACNKADTRTATTTTPATTADEGTRARTRDVAYVRFIDVHAQPADLYFGDQVAFSGEHFKGITDYKPLPAERHDFALRDAGRTAEDPLAKNSEGLTAGKYYTVVAFDDKKSPTLRVMNDDEKAPDAGKAKVRIIHAAPEMEAIDIYASGQKDKIASESRFTSSSNWQQVDPVTAPLEIRTSNKNEAPVRIPNVTLQPGKMYTFVVVGGQKSGERLSVIPIVDTPKDTRS